MNPFNMFRLPNIEKLADEGGVRVSLYQSLDNFRCFTLQLSLSPKNDDKLTEFVKKLIQQFDSSHVNVVLNRGNKIRLEPTNSQFFMQSLKNSMESNGFTEAVQDIDNIFGASRVLEAYCQANRDSLGTTTASPVKLTMLGLSSNDDGVHEISLKASSDDSSKFARFNGTPPNIDYIRGTKTPTEAHYKLCLGHIDDLKEKYEKLTSKHGWSDNELANILEVVGVINSVSTKAKETVSPAPSSATLG